MFYVYIVRCADDTLYTGIARDMTKRMNQHNGSLEGGAHYTKYRSPVVLVYFEKCKDRASAQKREHDIKKLPRKEKLLLIAHFQV